jgi:glycosyltransferase involved in cell wall biosynthesis
MSVIVNGFDIESFKPDLEARRAVRARLGLSDSNIVVAHVARFDPMKDHQTMLQAAQIAAQQDSRIHFILIGRGITPDNLAFEAASKEPLSGRVHLLGELDRLNWWLNGADIHVNSSISEGVCNAVGEGMAVGLPNVVTDVGDNSRLVNDTGKVVPSGQPEDLAQAILDICNLDQNGYTVLSRAARRRIEDNYSLEALRKGFNGLYSKIANGYK